MEYKSLNEASWAYKYTVKDEKGESIKDENGKDVEKPFLSRQAIFQAIKKGRLTAQKRLINGKTQWVIQHEDLQDYLKSKHIRENRIFDGKKLYNVTEGRWSVLHVAKYLMVPPHHVYYLLRIGELRAEKHANSWIIPYEQVHELEQKIKRKEFKTNEAS